MFQGLSLLMTAALLGGALASAYVFAWAYGQRELVYRVLAAARALQRDREQ